jgi:DNA-binding beta-propeller fold protein YncE
LERGLQAASVRALKGTLGLNYTPRPSGTLKRPEGRAPNFAWGTARLCSFLLALLPLIFGGCQPPSPASGTHLDSKLFSAVQILGSRGTALGKFNKPRSLAVDLEDNLYVADMTGRIQKFTPAGKFLLSWQMPETDRGKPKGMGRDARGNIVVIEPHYSRINHFSPAGRLVEQWGAHGTNDGQFTLPRSVAVTSQGNLLISEYTRVDRVQCFEEKTKALLLAFGTSGSGPGQFNRPEGLAVDREDRIYVADCCNHRIQIFSPQGRWLASFGHAGTGPGEFSYPYDVRVDAEGRIYVCEFGNSRIQIFNANHDLLEMIGGAGSAPGQFNNPWAITLDARGDLYVADAGNHRVQKFIRKFPFPGAAPRS